MVPETGLTINPIGEMVLCCAGDNVAVSHIKDVDNLSDFFNGPIYDKLRKDFTTLETVISKIFESITYRAKCIESEF